MNLKDVLEYWKSILVFIVAVASATYGVLTWAEDQKQLIRAEQQLIHNNQYQESRVQQKRDQIFDNLKMIRLLQSDDDELSLQEQKFVDSLREENIRLEADIEEIESIIRENEE
jgi:hypothetical protein